jgi:hypothetical protein
VLTIPVILASVAAGLVAASGVDATGVASAMVTAAPPWVIALGVLIPDYLLTIGTAIVARRASYLILGLAFAPLRILDAFLCLRALRRAFVAGTGGRWVSPTRRVDTVV